MANIRGTAGDDILEGTSARDTIRGLDGHDWLIGGGGNDTVYGGNGNDSLEGGVGNDTLDGGAGDDWLIGGDGNDTYLFGIGSGQDIIENIDGSGTDRIVLGPGITTNDVLIVRQGSMLVIQIKGTSEFIRVWDHFTTEANAATIDFIQFADSTLWDVNDILANVTRDPTAGDDVLSGGAGNDVISGLAGDDFLQGAGGNDTLYGDGGADYLSGEDGNDIMDGGAGDDWMDGGYGNDTYLFGIGSGRDQIHNDVYEGGVGVDRVLLGAGITEDDIVVGYHEGSLVFSIKGTSDRFEVHGDLDFEEGIAPIDFIQFADGTIWDMEDMLSRLNRAGTPDDDFILGTEASETLTGLAGNDWLDGASGNDTLDGGSGDDLMIGGSGNDTYRFGLGSGHDIIEDRHYGNDRIQLGAGIATSDVILYRDENHLTLRINGTEDTLVVAWHYDYTEEEAYEIESIRFADGTVWNQSTIDARAIWAGTGDDDELWGSAGNDLIDGLAGNDTIYGQEGNDTIDGSAGDDFLDGGLGKDLLRGGAGNDSMYGQGGNDILMGGAGDDTMYGNAGNDKLYGDAGNDTLIGNAGADAFIFATALDAATNVDTIGGYTVADDTIHLDKAVFTALSATGVLNAAFFHASATGDAADADDYILYETDTGMLFYDADGSGAGAKVQFALIGTVSHAALSAGEFVVI